MLCQPSTTILFIHPVLHQRKHQSFALISLPEENPQVTERFPTQRSSKAENLFIARRLQESFTVPRVKLDVFQQSYLDKYGL